MAKKNRRDDDDDDADLGAAKPKNDAYTGLLVLTLLAVIAGCVLMYLDHEVLAAQTLTAPNVSGSQSGLEYVVGARP